MSTLPEGGVSTDNFQQHRLFTANVILRKRGEPLDPLAPASLVIGDLFNQHNRLGRGSFGMVVRGLATHPPPAAPTTLTAGEAATAVVATSVVGQHVAVKIIHKLNDPTTWNLLSPEGPEWDTTVKELMTELNTLLAFQHRHVVRVHCFGLQRVMGIELPGYIALHLCSKGTLELWITENRFGDTDVACFTQHLIDAMQYLHTRRIVHRDIKPSNIFIDLDSLSGHTVLVVGDLGSAKAVRQSMTHASSGGLTVAYLAPEVYLTQACSFESDVYAASSVVVEMLTLASVYNAEQEAARTAVNQGSCTALVAAQVAARRECADLAVAATRTLAVADDCWVTRSMVTRLSEAIAQERHDRCTFVELFEEAQCVLDTTEGVDSHCLGGNHQRRRMTFSNDLVGAGAATGNAGTRGDATGSGGAGVVWGPVAIAGCAAVGFFLFGAAGALGAGIGIPAIISKRNRKQKLAGIPAWIERNVYELQIRSTRAFRAGTRLSRVELIFPDGFLVRLSDLEAPDIEFFHRQVLPASDTLDAGNTSVIDFGSLMCQMSPVDVSLYLGTKKHKRAGGMYGVFSDLCIFAKKGLLNGCYALRFSTGQNLDSLRA